MTHMDCPLCDEDVMIEFDATLQRFVCHVCARQWARSVEDEARALARVRVRQWPQMRERARRW